MTSSRELLESASRKARDRSTALPFDSNPDSPESAENGLIQARLLATRHDLDGARALLLVLRDQSPDSTDIENELCRIDALL